MGPAGRGPRGRVSAGSLRRSTAPLLWELESEPPAAKAKACFEPHITQWKSVLKGSCYPSTLQDSFNKHRQTPISESYSILGMSKHLSKRHQISSDCFFFGRLFLPRRRLDRARLATSRPLALVRQHLRKSLLVHTVIPVAGRTRIQNIDLVA